MNLKNLCEVPSMFRCWFCAYRVTFRRNINEPLLVVILETQKKTRLHQNTSTQQRRIVSIHELYGVRREKKGWLLKYDILSIS